MFSGFRARERRRDCHCQPQSTLNRSQQNTTRQCRSVDSAPTTTRHVEVRATPAWDGRPTPVIRVEFCPDCDVTFHFKRGVPAGVTVVSGERRAARRPLPSASLPPACVALLLDRRRRPVPSPILGAAHRHTRAREPAHSEHTLPVVHVANVEIGKDRRCGGHRHGRLRR